jgi:hypothetical protein
LVRIQTRSRSETLSPRRIAPYIWIIFLRQRQAYRILVYNCVLQRRRLAFQTEFALLNHPCAPEAGLPNSVNNYFLQRRRPGFQAEFVLLNHPSAPEAGLSNSVYNCVRQRRRPGFQTDFVLLNHPCAPETGFRILCIIVSFNAGGLPSRQSLYFRIILLRQRQAYRILRIIVSLNAGGRPS